MLAVNKTKKSRLPAFTLIELLVYVAVLSAMSMVVADTFLILNKGRAHVDSRSELNSNFNFIFEKMQRDAAAADSLVFPAVAGEFSNYFDLSISGEIVKYEVLAGRLTRRVGLSEAEVISASGLEISEPLFTRFENFNPVLGKSKVGIEVEISAVYLKGEPDVRNLQNRRTILYLSPDF